MFSVLYVDDEPALLELGKLFLERTLEFRVDVALSAIDALASPAFPSYDVIVSDYQMPEMDGIAFLKIVRERFGDIPFILFTGRGREDVVIEAINNGADFYLQKGGDVKPQFAELSHKIRQALARRQAEHSLRESEKRLADIINFLPDATFAINREGVIIAWNRAIDEMTGLSAEMMLGKGDHEYALPFYGERRPILIDLIFEPSEVIEQKYSNIIRQKDVLIADTNLPRLQGREVTLVGKASPLYNSQGEVVGAIEAIRDITEQKRAEDELQAACEQITASEGELREQLVLQAESEAKYRELAELLPQIVFEMDRNLIITFVNRQGYIALGYTPDDVAQGFNALSVVDPLQHSCIRENIRKIINREPYESPEFTLKRKDGSTFTALIYSDPVYKNGDLTGFRGIVIDISDRKKAENALHESEATLASIFRAAPVGIGLVSNRVLLRANDRLCEMTGYSAGELIGKSARILYSDDEEFERVGQDKYEQIQKSGTGTVETRWQQKDGDIRDILLSSTPLDPENHAAGVTFTALDITDRKRMENTLLEQQAKQTNFMQNLPAGLFRTTPGPSGRRIMVNPIIASMHGFDSIEEFMQTPVADNYADAAMRKILSDRLLHEGKLANVEVQMKKKTGELFWASLSAIAVRGPNGEIEYFDGVIEDITERKKAEEALRESEEKYRNVIEFSPFGMHFYELHDDGSLVFTGSNPAADAILGVDNSQFIGRTIEEAFPGLVDTEVPDKYRMVARTGDSWNTDQVIYDKGTIHGAFSVSAFQIRPGAMAAAFFDITERKRAEEELRSAHEQLTASEEELRGQFDELVAVQGNLQKSQEQLEEIASTVPGVVYQFYARPDGSMGVYYVSSRAGEVFGLDNTTQDFFAWFTEYVDPRDREAFLQSIIEVVKAGQPWNFEGRFIKPSGEKIWFQGISRPVARQGELVYSGVLLDITQRKLAEEAIRNSEAALREKSAMLETLFNAIPDVLGVQDLHHGIIRYNAAGYAMVGKNHGEVAGKRCFELIGHDAPCEICATSETYRTKKPAMVQKYVQEINAWLDVRSYPVLDDSGDIQFIIEHLRDISGQKLAEEAQHESEEKYRTLVETTGTGFVIIDDQGLVLDANPEYIRLSGHRNLGQIAGRSVIEWTAEYEKDKNAVAVSQCIRDGYIRNLEIDYVNDSGTIIPIEINATVLPYGDAVRILTLCRDISKRRITQDALCESEARLSSILQGSPVLQFVIDRNHKVISWNKAIEVYSGIKAEDIVGTDQQWRAFYPQKRPVLADLLVDEKNDEIPKLYGGKFRSSRLVEGAYEATDFFPTMGASGKWLNFTAAPIRDTQGTIIGAVETLEDITERRNAEQAVIEANHKLNLLNSITRHDVANQLTILQGFAQIAAMKKGDPVIADYLAKILTAADTIARQIEFTRTYQELGVKAPVWISVEEVIANVESRVPVKFSSTCRGVEVFTDPMLERVFFNLFDNAIRHGDRITEITIRCEREPDRILVIVEDNGSGVPAAEKEKIFERGVGKNTGLGLFLVREILSITGSTIKETGVYGKGARFEISVPEGKYRFAGQCPVSGHL
ncbi:MAG: PAS domain S-box protein [Methanoregula sp.]|nr:PAS domain S-box protein [Methanoregula sp.]